MKKTPKLRFPEFSGEWEERKCSSIFDKVRNSVDVKENEMYRQIGIRSHGKGLFYKEEVTGKELGNKRVFWVEPNVFVVNIVFAWERAVARTTENDLGLIASHRFPMYKPKEGILDLDYITYFFKTNKGKSLLELASPGGAGRNKTLGQKEFDNLDTVLPEVKEQKKIAKFLSVLEIRIDKQQEKVEALEEYKNGIMQKIFSHERRFKDENGDEYSDWNIKKLDDIITFIQSGLSRKLEEKDIGIPVVRSNNLIDGKIDIEDIRYWHNIDNQGAKLENYFLKKGDLLVNFINSLAQIGKCSIYNNEFKRNAIFTTNIIRLNFTEEVKVEYVFYYFQLAKYKNYIKNISKPAVNQASFTTVDFKNFTIDVPCEEEQEKIVNLLNKLEKKYNKEKEKLEQLKKLKKGLLQQMFV